MTRTSLALRYAFLILILAASCAVEGVGASSLGDRQEVRRRLEMRERYIEEGECDD